MDGKWLLRAFLDALDEDVAEEFRGTDARIAYQYLDNAAIEFVRMTRCLTSSVTIKTVAGQQAYDLPPDFIGLYLKDSQNRFFIRYFDGNVYSKPLKTSYEKIFRDHETTAREIPTSFDIIDRQQAPETISGTASADGGRTGGLSVLQDGTKKFLTEDIVYPRDMIHNETDDSNGIVISVTSEIQATTALFAGKKDRWSKNDQYTIVRASGKQIFLNAPSATTGHEMTIPYVCMPSPVYSDYGFWRFPAWCCQAIVYEAAFQYENREGDYKAADRHHALFIEETVRQGRERALNLLQNRRRCNQG